MCKCKKRSRSSIRGHLHNLNDGVNSTTCLPQARSTCVGATTTTAPEAATRIPFQATRWGGQIRPALQPMPALFARSVTQGGARILGRRPGWSNHPRGMMAALLFSITRRAACCRDHLSAGKLPERLARLARIRGSPAVDCRPASGLDLRTGIP